MLAKRLLSGSACHKINSVLGYVLVRQSEMFSDFTFYFLLFTFKFIIMPVPKQRHNKSRRDRRRVNQKLNPKNTQKCSKCGAFIMPHRVCPKCGYYKGREVINVLKKKTKK